MIILYVHFSTNSTTIDGEELSVAEAIEVEAKNGAFNLNDLISEPTVDAEDQILCDSGAVLNDESMCG